MATFAEAWRVVTDRGVLGDTALQASRVLDKLNEADAACRQAWEVCEDFVAASVEESYDEARKAIGAVAGELHVIGVRLRHLTG